MKKTRGVRLLKAVRDQMAEVGAADVPAVAPFAVGGTTYHLRTLTAERLAALTAWRMRNRGDGFGLRLRMIQASLVDAAGNELLTLDAVSDLPAVVAVALIDEVARRNGMFSD